MEENEFRHTGLWPFNILWSNRGESPAGDSHARGFGIFDPVALAYKAGSKLIDAGWVGLELMPTNFLWPVVDAKPDEVEGLVSGWIKSNQAAIADEFERRFASYTVEDLATRAAKEALYSYRVSHFIATVRTPMPEFERFGRMVVDENGCLPSRQKEAVEAIQHYLGNFPAGFHPPIESLTGYKIISEDLFARCFTQADAEQLGPGPNRHAEIHGLASYGDLRGAAKMICVTDLMLKAVSLAEVEQTGEENVS